MMMTRVSTLMISNAIERGEVNLDTFKYVVIYDSEKASFIELELEALFEHNGLRVIGETDVQNPSVTLGARYKEAGAYNSYGQMVSVELTVLLENMADDKTLVTASGSSSNRTSAWKAVSKKLNIALSEQGVPK
jgi:hypothetical protein